MMMLKDIFAITSQVEAVKSGLHSSLLVRHPETQVLYVNFDPQILTLIRETECMYRLGLDVPIAAKAIHQKQAVFKENYNKLKVSQQPLKVSDHWRLLGIQC